MDNFFTIPSFHFYSAAAEIVRIQYSTATENMAFCLQLPLLQIPLKKAPPPFNTSFPRHQLKLSDSRSSLPSLRSSSPSKTLKCFAQRQSTQQFERLFSNLNQATLKREPGELNSPQIPLAFRLNLAFLISIWCN